MKCPKCGYCDEPEPQDGILVPNAMPRITGETHSFRCHCGGNVFHTHKSAPDEYHCNCCGQAYVGSDTR
jgi:predicted SprT family Zn-dependent metalloprotease